MLLGLFFITIGMMLDWHILVDRWALVLALLAVPLLVKAVIILVLARLMGATTGVALRSGLFLAQAGEFGFVLLSLTQETGWCSRADEPHPGGHGAVDAGHAPSSSCTATAS